MILTSRLFRKIKSFFLHMIGKKDIDEIERKLGIINTSPGATAPPPPPDENQARERRKP
ncbi:MAG: hypothetical protein ACTSU6_03305 [Candidatus Njordarchaeales archaeon]